MINFKRPMLAAPLLSPKVEHNDCNILVAMQKLKYPVLATLKKDGIRAIRLGNSLVSRTLKLIPNKSIRERSLKLPEGFDMELWNPSLKYEEVESIVMSREHDRSDEIQFHVLDWYHDLYDYSARMEQLKVRLNQMQGVGTVLFVPCPIENAKDLLYFFLRYEQLGEEGICFRTPDSPYKQGRSTLKEQYLVKLCRNLTSEAVIIGFKEQLENGNESKVSNIGLTERSHSIAKKYGKNTLGAISVTDIYSGKEFDLGTGFTDSIRREIWSRPNHYLNKIVTYKYKGGGKDLPRCPVFKGFRKDL